MYYCDLPYGISIHAVAGTATNPTSGEPDGIFISIHAVAGTATYLQEHSCHITSHFNPRRRRDGDGRGGGGMSKYTTISIHAVAGTATANITIFHRTILPQFQSYCTIISAFSHISSISHHRKALISVFFRCEPPRKFMFTSGSHRNRRMYAGL